MAFATSIVDASLWAAKVRMFGCNLILQALMD